MSNNPKTVAIDLKRYEFIDAKSKDLINGYIRANQSLFPNSSSYNIPLNVNYIVTIFYCIIFDQLAEEYEKTPKKLLEIVNENDLFVDMAKYCIEKADDDLWDIVLSKDNKKREILTDKMAKILPTITVADQVAEAVKAVMLADIPLAMLNILENIILMTTNCWSKNKNLQNLLILTGIKAYPSKVNGYIRRLDNYDGPDLAMICKSDQYKLYEESLFIYKKFDCNQEAIDVFIIYLNDIQRAKEFAINCDKPKVWTKLLSAQLDNNLIEDAMVSILKSDYQGIVKYYNDVLECFNKCDKIELYDKFIELLKALHDKLKYEYDIRAVDSELIYYYAKTNNAEFEQFIEKQETLNGYMLMKMGDRLFNDKLFHGAQIIFKKVSHHAKLAACNKAILENLDNNSGANQNDNQDEKNQ